MAAKWNLNKPAEISMFKMKNNWNGSFVLFSFQSRKISNK